MEFVDFYPKTFQEIEDQDNPAKNGSEECYMIVAKNEKGLSFRDLGGNASGLIPPVEKLKPRAKVLHIIPDENDFVNNVALFWKHETAIEYCEIRCGIYDNSSEDIKTEGTLNSSEAIYGFAAWLTSRKKQTMMSSSDDSALIVGLIKEFCETNNLPEISEQWPKYLIQPKEEKQNEKNF